MINCMVEQYVKRRAHSMSSNSFSIDRRYADNVGNESGPTQYHHKRPRVLSNNTTVYHTKCLYLVWSRGRSRVAVNNNSEVKQEESVLW